METANAAARSRSSAGLTSVSPPSSIGWSGATSPSCTINPASRATGFPRRANAANFIVWDTGGIGGQGETELLQEVRSAADAAMREADVIRFHGRRAAGPDPDRSGTGATVAAVEAPRHSGREQDRSSEARKSRRGIPAARFSRPPLDQRRARTRDWLVSRDDRSSACPPRKAKRSRSRTRRSLSPSWAGLTLANLRSLTPS